VIGIYSDLCSFIPFGFISVELTSQVRNYPQSQLISIDLMIQDQLSASLKMRGPMLQRGSGGVPPGRNYASHVAQPAPPSVSSVAPARQVYPPWKSLGDGGSRWMKCCIL